MYKRLLLIIALCVSMIAVLQPLQELSAGVWPSTIAGIGFNFGGFAAIDLPSATKTACNSCHVSPTVATSAPVSVSPVILAKKPGTEERDFSPYNILVNEWLKKLANVSKIPKLNRLIIRDPVVKIECVNYAKNQFQSSWNSAFLPGVGISEEFYIDPEMVDNGNANVSTVFYYDSWKDDINAAIAAAGLDDNCGKKSQGKSFWERVGDDWIWYQFYGRAVLETEFEDGTLTDHEIEFFCEYVDDPAPGLDCEKTCDSQDPDFPDCPEL
jgi:hypothetical protein